MMGAAVTAPSHDQSPAAARDDARQAQGRSEDAAWHALVLKTFQGDEDGQAARLWATQLAALVPPLTPGIGVHVDGKGAMVLFGRYENWEDPQSAKDMETLHGLRVNGKRIFGPIIRTVVYPPRDPADLHPHELLALRHSQPATRILYTLEIGVWGDFDSGELPDQVRRQQAESQVASLRQSGIPAYFHHDPVSRLSTVTVGVFDESAVDPASSLLSPEAERWQKQFPFRLTNGEELRLPIPGRPDLGVVPQRSRLVLVPEF